MEKTVAIINYNTPELTEAAIWSLRKHGGQDYKVVVFDNSTERPFRKPMVGVEVIDNTKGQVIDFDKALAKFPQRNRAIGCARGNEFGSVKHMMTVQKLWELLPDGFVLMESDILLRKSIDEFFNPKYSVVAYIQKEQPRNRFHIGRVLPMLCWFNVPKFKAEKVKYFDPKRSWGLKADPNDRTNWYDTGASLLEDILSHRPRLKGLHLDINQFVVHYGSGSWMHNFRKEHVEWLNQHKDLWQPQEWPKPETDKIALCAIGRLENRYAKEWVDHHLKAGFDKIYIYDNNHDGEEQFDDVLKTQIAKGKVEIVDWRNREHQQCAAYQDFYEKHGREYAWTAFLDFDEFLHIEQGVFLRSVLGQTKASVVKVNWECYGDNGLVKADKRKVQTRFTAPLPSDIQVKERAHKDNQLTKCFVRGGLPYTVWTNPHCPKVPGTYAYIDGTLCDGTSLHNPDYTVARVKHYLTKTIEEWMTGKVVRGEGSSKVNTETLRKNAIDIFFRYNERTPEKEQWLKENGYLEK